MSEKTLDPAVIDRRNALLTGISAAALPQRRMTIAGIEGALDAVTLSKDMKGPASRLATFPAGWGSGVSGAFTEEVEIFVLEGEMQVGRSVLGRHDYAAIPAGGVFPGLRALTAGKALLMTAAPVRYDTASGGRAAELHVVHSGDESWSASGGAPGRFEKQLSPSGSAALTGFLEWRNQDASWVAHDVGEECFVIEGEVRFAEMIEGEATVFEYGPDTYLWRPPGSPHCGPGSSADDAALAFVRRPGGPGSTTTVEAGGASDSAENLDGP